MTEEQWLTCTDAGELLAYLRSKKNNRKLRLFGCACYRRIWHLVPDWESSRSATERFYKAVEISEQYADKLVSGKELDRMRVETMASPIHVTFRNRFFEQIGMAATDAQARAAGRIHFDPKNTTPIRERLEKITEKAAVESKAQATILRDIFGNPFCPITISPVWLTRNNGIVVRLAQAAYDERILPAGTLDNTRLLILADALEEAGCTDEQILTHLRGGGEHYRGCWVIDLLLGKD
jgi:hypothetical protein